MNKMCSVVKGDIILESFFQGPSFYNVSLKLKSETRTCFEKGLKFGHLWMQIGKLGGAPPDLCELF